MTTAFRVGSLASDVLADIKRGNNFAVINNYSTFEHPDGTPYSVTAGKTLYITRVRFTSTAGPGRISIGYGDDAVDDSALAPTTPVLVDKLLGVVTAELLAVVDCFTPIPAGKFPFFVATLGGAYASFEGIEITNP